MAKDDNGLTILGKTVREPVRKLETFPAPKYVTEVTMETNEWTSMCPVTGQPDFCSLKIIYLPRECCLESKALKLYVWSFRDAAMFVETIADTVAADLVKALEPRRVRVEVRQAVRGGIGIVAVAERLCQ
jgi:7-cyano-7-deazaguanine reductase